MDLKITGTPKEIADLVKLVQNQPLRTLDTLTEQEFQEALMKGISEGLRR